MPPLALGAINYSWISWSFDMCRSHTTKSNKEVLTHLLGSCQPSARKTASKLPLTWFIQNLHLDDEKHSINTTFILIHNYTIPKVLKSFSNHKPSATSGLVSLSQQSFFAGSLRKVLVKETQAEYTSNSTLPFGYFWQQED